MHDLKKFRRFIMCRLKDESGVSGEGLIAEGTKFSSGKCVISWTSDVHSVEVYDSIDEIVRIHGHEGKTRIVWIDKEK